MTNKKVQKGVSFNKNKDYVVQKCVLIRKHNKESVSELAKWLDVDKRKIYRFEKGNFNLELANKILNWYGKSLILSIV